jgi:thiol-disulfide isomerase/thioredoxin
MQKANNTNSNKTILMFSGIAAAVIIIGAGGFILYSSSLKVADQKKKDEELAMVKNNDIDLKISDNNQPMNKNSTNAAMNTPGLWKPFSNDLVSSASGDKKVVLFFNASWCPTCQSTVKDINANLSKLDPNLILLSADYDKEISLRQKYGVTYQHTFVQVNSNGDLIKKKNGLDTVSQINAFIN